LAKQLNKLIRFRSTNEAFQLIIITHDQNLIQDLGTKNCLSQYYLVNKVRNRRLTRQENHFSVIQEKRFEDIKNQ